MPVRPRSSSLYEKEPIVRKLVRNETGKKDNGRASEIGFTRRKGTKKFKAEGRDGEGAKGRSSQYRIEALVATCHQGERCAGLARRRLYTTRSEADRRLAQAFRGTQLAPQGRRVSLGGFDAHLLHQPRRQDAAEDATDATGARQGRAQAPVWPGVTSRARGRRLVYWSGGSPIPNAELARSRNRA